MSHGCFNRPPFEQSIKVADGWESSWARRMVDMEFRMDPNCVYSSSRLGQEDKGCIGCKWRAEKADDEVS